MKNKKIFGFLGAAVLGLAAVSALAIKPMESKAGTEPFYSSYSWGRPLHVADPLTKQGDIALLPSDYLDLYASVDRTETGLHFDLAWANQITASHWISIVLGYPSDWGENVHINSEGMVAKCDKIMVKPVAGSWGSEFGNVVYATNSSYRFHDWPVAGASYQNIEGAVYNEAKHNFVFDVPYSVLKTMSSKDDDPNMLLNVRFHGESGGAFRDNYFCGDNQWWAAYNVNGTPTGDAAFLAGSPKVSACAKTKAASLYGSTHTWTFGGKYASEPLVDCRQMLGEVIRGEDEITFDLLSMGSFYSKGSIWQNIQLVGTTISSDRGGWGLNASDLVLRFWREGNNIVGSVSNNWADYWGCNSSNYILNGEDYAPHKVADFKSSLVEDTPWGTHISVTLDLTDTNLALFKGDFKIQGSFFTNGDGAWVMNSIWNLGGNRYFGSFMNDTGDQAAQSSYIPINEAYFAKQSVLHNYFDNYTRDANGSICALLSDNTKLSALKTWYEGLSTDMINVLAKTPDFDVSAKEAIEYLLTNGNVGGFSLASSAFLSDNSNNLFAIVLAISAGVACVGMTFFLKKRKER